MKKLLQNNPLIFIIFIYVLARGFMLLINGVWWDDWLIWNAPRETLVHNWITEGNAPHLAAIHLFIYDHVAVNLIPLVYRLIAFISGLVSVLLIFEILRCFKMPLQWRVGITALVASSPMNTAALLMCCMMYNVSTPLFFLGALLFLKGIEKESALLKIGASIALFLSLFFWMSPIVLIPFMVLVVALWQIKPERWSYTNIRQVFVKCLSWWYIWIVPIAYWIVRSIFFAPKVQFEEYYAVNFKSILLLPLTIVQSLIKNVLGLLGYDIDMISSGSLSITIGVLILMVVVVVIARPVFRLHDHTPMSKRQSWNILWLGIILFVGALIPTTIIAASSAGDSSGFDTIQSRYQVLMLLPTSLMIYVLLAQFRSVKLQRAVLTLVIAASVFASVRTLLNYQRGWFKQLAVVSIIKNEPLLHEPNVNVVVKDLATDVNEYTYGLMPDYAYSGMSNLALNDDQTHRYISTTAYEKAISYDPQKDNYKIAGAEKCADPTVFHYTLWLEKRQYDILSSATILKLTILQYTNADAFNKVISDMLTYTLEPVVPCAEQEESADTL